jgi:hypothetical protein
VETPSPRHTRRREKLEELLLKVPAKDVAAAIGTPASHLSAIRKGTRGIGDKLADKIERFAIQRFGEAPGWIDAEPAEEQSLPFRDLDALEVQLVTYFRLMGDGERHDLLVQLSQRTATAQTPTATRTWASSERRIEDVGHVPDRRVPRVIRR